MREGMPDMSREKTPRPAAIIVLKNKLGEVLLLRRTAQDRSFVGWSFPGGKQEPNDANLLATALVELAQETGLVLTEATLMNRDTATDRQGRNYDVAVYQVELPDGEVHPTITLSSEHEDFRWLKPQTVLDSPAEYPLAGEMTRRTLAELIKRPEIEKSIKAWPLPGIDIEVPQEDNHPGSFGAKRKFDRHTGVDLYAAEGQPVVAVEDGIVVAIDAFFTGGEDTPKNPEGEPIWLPTAAVLIEGVSGVLLYGEIKEEAGLTVGDKVKAGQQLGTILRVLRPKPEGEKYKNPANSASMLHFERYAPGTTRAVVWELNQPKPEPLIDPTSVLLVAKNK